MKIGIITFHRALNYGAALQAYALSHFLKECGHDVYFIDYHVDGKSKSLLTIFSRILLIFEIFFTNPIRFYNVIKMKLFYKEKISGHFNKDRNKADLLRKSFFDFASKHFIPTQRTYFSPLELKLFPPKFDAYITGSDQVWGYGQTTFSDAYFLNFGKRNVLRIAYAPSFGKPYIPSDLHKELRKKIKRFNAVSVREKSGVSILSEVCNLKATHVLDPVFLLDNFDSITNKVSDDKYMLEFRLEQGDILKQRFKRLSKYIAESLSLETKIVAPMEVINSDSELNVGVEDFLGYVTQANFIITNSFHGTALAIINKINFISCSRTDTNIGQNDRIISLLSEFGLERRYLDLNKEFNENTFSIVSETINWENVEAKLIDLKERSYQFLIKSLQ